MPRGRNGERRQFARMRRNASRGSVILSSDNVALSRHGLRNDPSFFQPIVLTIMAKKKNIATEPARLTPEKMTEARALFAEDPCVYTLRQLKKVLTQKLAWSRGAANAGALALMEEGPVVTVRHETYYRGRKAEPVLVEYRDEALTDADDKSEPASL